MKFYEVKLKIKPLEDELNSAEAQLRKSQKAVDKNTKEIWFMGVLTKPNNWENDQNFYEQTFEPEI